MQATAAAEASAHSTALAAVVRDAADIKRVVVNVAGQLVPPAGGFVVAVESVGFTMLVTCNVVWRPFALKPSMMALPSTLAVAEASFRAVAAGSLPGLLKKRVTV